jgi:phosphoglycolate phosphatase-like HAD superfamily hydrolase
VITHIIWRLDGGLFDTYPALTYAWSRTLKDLGVSLPLNEIGALARQPYLVCLEGLARRYKLECQALHQHFCTAYLAVPQSSQLPHAGAAGVCAALHARGGVNAAVPQQFAPARLLLEAYGLLPYFLDIPGPREDRQQALPDWLLALLSDRGLTPAEALFITGRTDEANAVRAAGLPVYLVSGISVDVPLSLDNLLDAV